MLCLHNIVIVLAITLGHISSFWCRLLFVVLVRIMDLALGSLNVIVNIFLGNYVLLCSSVTSGVYSCRYSIYSTLGMKDAIIFAVFHSPTIFSYNCIWSMYNIVFPGISIFVMRFFSVSGVRIKKWNQKGHCWLSLCCSLWMHSTSLVQNIWC